MQNLIEKVKDRDPDALRQLIVKNQRLLYSIALSSAGPDAADDIVQATWERALTKLNQLQNHDNFTSWICSICRNILSDSRRKNLPEMDEFDESFMTCNRDSMKNHEQYENHIRLAMQMLSDEQRMVVQLRFFSDFSYSDIALACCIEEKLVKSRLYEAKKKLKHHLSNLYNGLTISQKQLDHMEELIMNKFERATLGANVFCRLSLNTQMQIVNCIKENTEFQPEILGELGKVKDGAVFLEEYHKKLLLPEFIYIINACDRYTEFRLVAGLEQTDPSAAEMVKQNTFVFEDLAILTPETRARLFESVDETTIKKAMSIVSSRVKSMLLSHLDDEQRDKWYRDIGMADSDLDEVRAAQLKVVSVLREMNERNEVELQDF